MLEMNDDSSTDSDNTGSSFSERTSGFYTASILSSNYSVSDTSTQTDSGISDIMFNEGENEPERVVVPANMFAHIDLDQIRRNFYVANRATMEGPNSVRQRFEFFLGMCKYGNVLCLEWHLLNNSDVRNIKEFEIYLRSENVGDSGRWEFLGAVPSKPGTEGSFQYVVENLRRGFSYTIAIRAVNKEDRKGNYASLYVPFF